MRIGKKSAVVVSALALVVGLAGCSSSDDDSASEASTTSDSASAFPVTLTGALGTSEVKAEPTRVVALSATDADYVFSLGVTPVAIESGSSDSGYQPWIEEQYGADVPPLLEGLDGDFSVEEIAALKPDLIVATKVFGLDSVYEQLATVAPVVHFADNPSTETWQNATKSVAAALGVPEKGEEVVSATEADIAGAADEYPNLDGKSFTFFVGPAEDSVYIVNSDADAGASFLKELGMAPTEFATSQPESSIPGRAQISYELLSQTDADIVIATGRPGTVDGLLANPAVVGLPAVQRGAVVPLEAVPAQSIAFPSSLSLEWALAEIVPQLDAAAQK